MIDKEARLLKRCNTGAVDKNGTPIHEGDIVLTPDGRRCTIDYALHEFGCCEFIYRDFNFVNQVDVAMHLLRENARVIEVVGNIYEV